MTAVPQWLSTASDLLIVAGVPFLTIIFWRLYRSHLDVLRDKAEFLDKMKFSDALRELEAQTKLHELQVERKEQRIAELEEERGQRDAEIGRMQEDLLKLRLELAEFSDRRAVLSKHADAAAVQQLVSELRREDREEYFAQVFRSALIQAQKAYQREDLPPQEEGPVWRETAAQYSRDWAKRKGVLKQWKRWWRTFEFEP